MLPQQLHQQTGRFHIGTGDNIVIVMGECYIPIIYDVYSNLPTLQCANRLQHTSMPSHEDHAYISMGDEDKADLTNVTSQQKQLL
jgi:hypothetical protein